MQPNVKVYISDFDGVILESEAVKNQAICEWFSNFPQIIEKSILKYHLENYSLPRKIKLKYLFSLLVKEKIIFSERTLSEQLDLVIFEAVRNSKEVLGAKLLLQTISKYIPIYIVSVTPYDALCKTLEFRNFKKYISGVFGSEISKPNAIKKILNKHSIFPQNAVLVGDGINDQDAAIATGIHFIGRTIKKNIFKGNVLFNVFNMRELHAKIQIENDFITFKK